MLIIENFAKKYYSERVLFIIILLFFFQMISDFVEAVYALCLLTLSLNENVLSILFLLSPILLLLFKERLSRKSLVFIGEFIIVCRVLEAMFVTSTQLKMIFTGMGVGAFFIFFPTVLSYFHDKQEEGLTLTLDLIVAIMLSVVFRIFGSSVDISTHGFFQIIGWILAIIASFMLLGYYFRLKELSQKNMAEEGKRNTRNVFLAVFGLLNVFLLVYFSFLSPTVIARWTEGNYFMITIIITLILLAFALLLLYKRELFNKINIGIICLGNSVFLGSLGLLIFSHQTDLPLSDAFYPIYAQNTTLLHEILLIIMLLSFPILFIDLMLFLNEIVDNKPTVKQLGGSFTLATLFFVIMIFAQVFTTVYDYIDVVGPLFRDMFWLVFLIGGLGVFIPILILKVESFQFGKPSICIHSITTSIVIGLIFFSGLIGLIITTPQPITPNNPSSLKVVTYNIRQAYSETGIKNFDGQLEVLQQEDADIIGLQESDPARISGGNTDPVRYFADNLDMYSYYGPKTVTGTFGVALLSKYPIKNARTFFMYSEGEQTATIIAEIQVSSVSYSVFVTHLGNGGPIIQQEAILSEVIMNDNIILMGDFNFRPDSAQYNLTTSILNDSWILKWNSWLDDNNYNASRKIDHIFVSPGMTIIDTRIVESKASDHPLVWATISI